MINATASYHYAKQELVRKGGGSSEYLALEELYDGAVDPLVLCSLLRTSRCWRRHLWEQEDIEDVNDGDPDVSETLPVRRLLHADFQDREENLDGNPPASLLDAAVFQLKRFLHCCHHISNHPFLSNQLHCIGSLIETAGREETALAKQDKLFREDSFHSAPAGPLRPGVGELGQVQEEGEETWQQLLGSSNQRLSFHYSSTLCNGCMQRKKRVFRSGEEKPKL